MEREALLALLTATSFVALAWSAGAATTFAVSASRGGRGSLAPPPPRARDAARAERRAWLRLFAPLTPGVAASAVLLGWALHAPDPAQERPTWVLVLLGAAAGAVLARAGHRAWRSWRGARWLEVAPIAPAGSLAATEPVVPVVPVATVGLVSPRIVLSPRFQAAASPPALAAALAHERAHVRARDPLRLWVAQLATDLQWPIPGAARRLRTWEHALELRRDQEALADGADPAALAEAILLAARLLLDGALGGAPVAVARLGDGQALRARVGVLLDATTAERAPDAGPPAADAPRVRSPRRDGVTAGRRSRRVALALGALGALVALGYTTGHALLSALPWLLR